MRKKLTVLILLFMLCFSNAIVVYADTTTETTQTSINVSDIPEGRRLYLKQQLGCSTDADLEKFLNNVSNQALLKKLGIDLTDFLVKGETTENAPTDDFSSKLKEWLGIDVTESDIYNWSLAITTLKTDGFSNQAIAGILGNVQVEGGTNQFAIEGYSGKTTTDGKAYTQFEVGNSYDYGDTKPSLYTNSSGKTMGGEGHGLVQWSFGRADNLSTFASENKFGYVTVKHWHKSYDSDMKQDTYNIPNMAGQVCFMVQELNTSYTTVKEHIKDLTSASDAAKIFHDEYEKSGTGNVSDRQASAESAVAVVNACTGVTGSTSTSDEDTQELTKVLVQRGIWGEDKFITFNSLTETPLEFPSRDDLSKDQLEGISDWKNNIDYESEDGVIKYLRIFVMLAGIVFLVWVVLIYLSYWFDRINNFIDLDLLPMITFGRLKVAPEEFECTFNPKDFARGQAMTVNHKVVISLCLMGLFFAVFIISGNMFTVLNALVRFILHKLGMV